MIRSNTTRRTSAGGLKPQDADLIQQAVCLLSPRWTSAILIQLSSGKKRAKELKESLSPISGKTLTERLNALREKGLVKRIYYREVPPRVEYELTTRGSGLLDVLKSIKALSKKMPEKELHNWGNPFLR